MTVSPDLFRSGSQCPRCSAPLVADSVQAGRNYCTACSDEFEATTFRPPERRVRPTAEVITSGPEGAAACANHVRNAAVTSCQRCGLFICSLCDMNLGEGSFCPSCFERVRTEGALRTAITRYHDYAGMARLSILGGLLCFYLSPFLAPLGIFLGAKAIRQRREEGRTTAGPIILIIFAALELLGGLSMIGLLIWSLFQTAKGAR